MLLAYRVEDSDASAGQGSVLEGVSTVGDFDGGFGATGRWYMSMCLLLHCYRMLKDCVPGGLTVKIDPP